MGASDFCSVVSSEVDRVGTSDVDGIGNKVDGGAVDGSYGGGAASA